MRRREAKARTCTLVILVSLFVLGAVVQAQPGGDFELVWWTVDGGGSESRDGNYGLIGTVGQPDAGLLSGGDFALGGGFSGGDATRFKVYLPILMRSSP
jgi:hypothetical protein